MSDENTTEATDTDTAEDVQQTDTLGETDETSTEEREPDSFPREVVEKLRQENGRYRQRAQEADTLAHRLHTELVRATGRLADPSDLEFNPDHLDDGESLAQAIDELLEQKPHLATRRPSGDIGQGNRGSSSEPFSLASCRCSRNEPNGRRAAVCALPHDAPVDRGRPHPRNGMRAARVALH
jgi:hypothetical protein